MPTAATNRSSLFRQILSTRISMSSPWDYGACRWKRTPSKATVTRTNSSKRRGARWKTCSARVPVMHSRSPPRRRWPSHRKQAPRRAPSRSPQNGKCINPQANEAGASSPSLRTPQRGNQPDRNPEVTVLPSHHLKPGEILRASAAGSPQRIAPGKFRDFREEVSRLERNLRRRPAHTHRKRSTLAHFQWQGAGLEFELDKRDGKRGRLAFRAGDFHGRRARSQVLGRKHHE